MKWLNSLLTPKRILKFIKKTRLLWAVLCAGCFAYGGYNALISSPPDYQQGEAVRMMYVHVPAAWMSLMVYTFMTLLAISALIWKNPTAYILLHCSAMVGMCFTFICLVTGSLWGKPIWGSWWVWDARLTSMLILFLFYVGYFLLSASFDRRSTAEQVGAIFIIVGAINLPIIKFSVDIWNTLHQPASILRKGGIAIHPDMLIPLLVMWAGYITYFLLVVGLLVEGRFITVKRPRHMR